VMGRSASRYESAVAWLTTPTPWVLVPQGLFGIAIGVFGAAETVYR
jgi:hypothetical protein